MREKYGKRVVSICIIACILISSYGTIMAQGMGLFRRSQINDMLSTYLLDVVSLDKVIDINDNCEKNEINFSLNDGTNTVYSFAEPVWFKDSAGNMSFKDVNIKKHNNPVFKKKGYEYSNGENDYRIYFSTSCEKGLLVENTGISFNIIPKTN